MKTLVRALILLMLTVWLGGVFFFPVVAAVSFSSLPDTHAAGTIVGLCLRILHYEGLGAGAFLVLLLIVSQIFRVYPRSIAPAFVLVVLMLALTAFSQFSIIPRMERFRQHAGGAINTADSTNPDTIGFNRLHRLSTYVEEGVLIAGLLFIAVIAHAESSKQAA
jgi:hypothetical protein